jgi:hypothetical protein
MGMLWQRKDNADLERALVSARAVPRDEFVARLLEQIGPTAPERIVPARGGRRRMGLAGVVTAAMVVFLAAFGGVGYARSSCSHAAHSVYHAVAYHHKNKPEPPHSTSSDTHSAAWYREHPRPGYFCGTKGSKHQLKLILTQQRYDRLVKSGWKLVGGPFSTASEARHSYPSTSWGTDDGGD